MINQMFFKSFETARNSKHRKDAKHKKYTKKQLPCFPEE